MLIYKDFVILACDNGEVLIQKYKFEEVKVVEEEEVKVDDKKEE